MRKKKEIKISEQNFVFIFLLIFILTISYFKLLNAQFVDWDDPVYVYENRKVIEGITLKNIKWAFTTIFFGFYYPLTWLSHMLDVTLYGLNPKGHHMTSIIIHIFNTLVLYFIFLNLNFEKIKSFFMSLLFSIHPLQVESVGWISERKNILSTLFFFLSTLLYVKWVKGKKYFYFYSSIFVFLLALMAKSSVVVLPLLLILLDYYPLKRLKFNFLEIFKSIREKILFFVLSFVFSIVTIIAQKEANAVQTTFTYPLDQRFANSLYSLFKYLLNYFFPLKLSAFYAHIRDKYSFFTLFLILIFFVALVLSFVKLKEKIYLIGFLWFFISLLPVIGLVQVGEQGMADRYLYFGIIGLNLWVVYFFFGNFKNLNISISFLAIISLFFMFLTIRQCEVWYSDETLFLNMIKNSNNPSQGYTLLGLHYKKRGEFFKAIELYKKAIESDPKNSSAYNNLGSALYEIKDIEGAKEAFKKAIELKPEASVYYYNLGLAEEYSKNIEEAKRLYLTALQKDEKSLSSRLKLISIYFREKNYDEALKIAREGKRLSKEEIDYYLSEAQILVELNRIEEAKDVLKKAERIFGEEPSLKKVWLKVFIFEKDFINAEIILKELMKKNLDNDVISLFVDLKIAQKKKDEALVFLQDILKSNPNPELFELLRKLKGGS